MGMQWLRFNLRITISLDGAIKGWLLFYMLGLRGEEKTEEKSQGSLGGETWKGKSGCYEGFRRKWSIGKALIYYYYHD